MNLQNILFDDKNDEYIIIDITDLSDSRVTDIAFQFVSIRRESTEIFDEMISIYLNGNGANDEKQMNLFSFCVDLCGFLSNCHNRTKFSFHWRLSSSFLSGFLSSSKHQPHLTFHIH